MALGAGGDTVLGELSAVHFFVALLALGRRSFEIHMDQRGFHVRRLVAIDAGGGTMGSD